MTGSVVLLRPAAPSAGGLPETRSKRSDAMAAVNSKTPSIMAFRSRIKCLLEQEANAAGRSRHIVVLGIDGLPYHLALRSWRYASTERMSSVFPTTSATGWLTGLSGLAVDAHGVPGVVFKIPEHRDGLINVFEYRGPLVGFEMTNIFSDAAGFGYVALSILGDLEAFDCSWRDLLLRHSRRVHGFRFYAVEPAVDAPLDPEILGRRLRRALLESLRAHGRQAPCLVWCFIDMDRHVHRFGYDDHVFRFLELIEQVALEMTEKDAVVIAHSDHGLTRTRNDPQVEELIQQLVDRRLGHVGGAGRARWIYPSSGTGEALAHELKQRLPSVVRIDRADAMFARGSLSRSRVGEWLLIAEGEEFLAQRGYTYDHGSLTDEEMAVPFSEWRR